MSFSAFHVEKKFHEFENQSERSPKKSNAPNFISLVVDKEGNDEFLSVQ